MAILLGTLVSLESAFVAKNLLLHTRAVDARYVQAKVHYLALSGFALAPELFNTLEVWEDPLSKQDLYAATAEKTPLNVNLEGKLYLYKTASEIVSIAWHQKSAKTIFVASFSKDKDKLIIGVPKKLAAVPK